MKPYTPLFAPTPRYICDLKSLNNRTKNFCKQFAGPSRRVRPPACKPSSSSLKFQSQVALQPSRALQDPPGSPQEPAGSLQDAPGPPRTPLGSPREAPKTPPGCPPRPHRMPPGGPRSAGPPRTPPRGRFGVDLGSVLGQFGFDFGPIGAEVGPVGGQFGVDLGARLGDELRSILGLFGLDVGKIWGRTGADSGSSWVPVWGWFWVLFTSPTISRTSTHMTKLAQDIPVWG